MMLGSHVVDQILDLARWAPSGDNTQPWRFERVDAKHLVVHGSDTRSHCVYDLDGHPSQLAIGALIETLAIAASGFGLRVDAKRRAGLPDDRPTIELALVPDTSLPASPLIASIPRRTVQRRGYSTRPLTDSDKHSLERAMMPGYQIRWFEGWAPRLSMARLMFQNARLRLTTLEAYQVHRDIIDWGRRYSADRVPDQALGVDGLTLRLMRWAMQDWDRVRFLNRWVGGTWMPRLQMDWLPSLRCAAHLVVMRAETPRTVDDYIESGRVVQRLWLTATGLGLQHQPELTLMV